MYVRKPKGWRCSRMTDTSIDCVRLTALYTATFSKPVVGDSYTVRREGHNFHRACTKSVGRSVGRSIANSP